MIKFQLNENNCVYYYYNWMCSQALRRCCFFSIVLLVLLSRSTLFLFAFVVFFFSLTIISPIRLSWHKQSSPPYWNTFWERTNEKKAAATIHCVYNSVQRAERLPRRWRKGSNNNNNQKHEKRKHFYCHSLAHTRNLLNNDNRINVERFDLLYVLFFSSLRPLSPFHRLISFFVLLLNAQNIVITINNHNFFFSALPFQWKFSVMWSLLDQSVSFLWKWMK